MNESSLGANFAEGFNYVFTDSLVPPVRGKPVGGGWHAASPVPSQPNRRGEKVDAST
jgi:hypothetical protein